MGPAKAGTVPSGALSSCSAVSGPTCWTGSCPVPPGLSTLFPPPSQATSSLQVRCDCELRAPPSRSVGPSDPRHSLLEEQGPVLALGPSLTSLGTPSLACPSGIG